jgi:aspartate racemase
MTVGIIGGLGPESTVDYYQSIIREYKRRTESDRSPAILIASVDMSEILSYVADRNYSRLADVLGGTISSLARAGADFAVIASNTPHVVFDVLRERSPIELISIVDAVCGRIRERGHSKPLLTGTLFTMRENFYGDTARKNGIQLVIPDAADMTRIHDVIFPELEEGIIVPAKKRAYLDLVNSYIKDGRIDSVILGCTELPLMISDGDVPVPVINTSAIHIDRIVTRLLEPR